MLFLHRAGRTGMRRLVDAVAEVCDPPGRAVDVGAVDIGAMDIGAVDIGAVDIGLGAGLRRHAGIVTLRSHIMIRPPLREAELRREVIGGLWTALDVVEETGSTNADLVSRARAGTPEGAILVAEQQVAGRGRLGRQWQSPARAGLAVSVLLRPRVPPRRLGWLPLLAGVALAESVRAESEVDAVLKWPNDLLIGGRKCAGILAEASNGAVVVGLGLNTTLTAGELPHPGATSLLLAGAAEVDRERLLCGLLRSLAVWYGRWVAAGGDADASGLRAAYTGHCATIGQRIRVELPGGEAVLAVVEGIAEGVDEDGRLLIAGQAIAAGDVLHVRN
jgi:BirA family biotin operon repressor/biotin-[acetyl-CoA-carboxylase] ligase